MVDGWADHSINITQKLVRCRPPHKLYHRHLATKMGLDVGGDENLERTLSTSALRKQVAVGYLNGWDFLEINMINI